jgi:hypothetical protein
MQKKIPTYRMRSRKSSTVFSQLAAEALEYMTLVNRRDCFGAIVAALYPTAPPVYPPSLPGNWKPYLWSQEPYSQHHFRVKTDWFDAVCWPVDNIVCQSKLIALRGNCLSYPCYSPDVLQRSNTEFSWVFGVKGACTPLLKAVREGDVTLLVRLWQQVNDIFSMTGVFYFYAWDPCAWLSVGDHLIYWPAHCMHDELKRFKKRGIVQMVLLSNKVVVVRPDKSIGLQIILCGLLLALQLVGGEKHYESSLFEDTDYELQQFSFADILRLTS